MKKCSFAISVCFAEKCQELLVAGAARNTKNVNNTTTKNICTGGSLFDTSTRAMRHEGVSNALTKEDNSNHSGLMSNTDTRNGDRGEKGGSSSHGRMGHQFAEFVELLSRFLLIASSRTLSSGDAFFVLNDLFGGEGLTLVPCARLSEKAKDEIRIDISPLHISVECSQFYDLYVP